MATKKARTLKRRKPTPDQIKDWAQKDKSFWEARNQEFQKWQEMWEMRHGKTPEKGEQSVTVNDGAVLVNKGAAMCSVDHRIIWPAPPDRPDLEEIAQKGENLLRFFRREATFQHSEGLHNDLTWEEASMVNLRGYIAGRLTLNPQGARDGSLWCDYSLLDPANIYPRYSGNRLIRVTHQYKAKRFELVDQYPEADKPGSEDEEVEVIGYYDDTYMGVMVGGDLVKLEEHGYGFCPVLMQAAAGAFYGATPYDDTEWVKVRGQGILAKNYLPIMDKQDVLSMMKTLLYKETNPPATAFTDKDGEELEIKLKAGARNVLSEKDRLELHRIGPNFNELMSAAGGFQDQINKGGFMPALFGDPQGTSSGFQGYLQAGSARDVVLPYLKCLETYYTLLYRRVVQLFVKFGAEGITFYGVDQQGDMVGGIKVTPEELSQLPPHIVVKFRTHSIQDQIVMAQTGAMLAREKVLSMHTVRGDWIEVDDPRAEDSKVLSELVYMEPAVTKALAVRRAMERKDPLLTEILMATMGSAKTPPPPGATPGATPGAPPEVPPALPPEVVPPEAGANAGALPGTDLLAPAGTGPDQPVPPDVLQAMQAKGMM